MTDTGTHALLDSVLLVAFSKQITTPDADSGIECLAANADRKAPTEAWRAAVAEATLAGYIRDPVRLPAGALQCHWHLELTPQGVEAARRLRFPPEDAG